METIKNAIKFPDIRPLNVKRYAKIISTGIGLPDNVVTNRDIIERYGLAATDRAVEYALGIKERRWVSLDQKHDGLIAKAVEQCLGRAGIGIEKVSRIIYSRLLNDYNIPAGSIGLLRKLEVDVGIPAFDISSACSGFLHAMDLALRFVGTGDEYVLIIGGGITSKGIQDFGRPNPKTVFLFGDAVAAMLIGYSEAKRFLSSYVFTNPDLYDNAYIPCGTDILNKHMAINDFDVFNMKIEDSNLILESSVEYARTIADKLLSLTDLSLEDLDFFITSDQSTRIWEAQLKNLGIPLEKSNSLFYKYGNTVAAMSALNLDGLIGEGRLKRGDLVMMMAHGAGASSGGVLFRY